MSSVHDFEYKSASLTLILWDDDRASISSLFSGERRQGHATEVMHRAIKFVDQRCLTLALVVEAFGENGMTNPELVDFYKKFGFNTNSTDEHLVYMERLPTWG